MTKNSGRSSATQRPLRATRLLRTSSTEWFIAFFCEKPVHGAQAISTVSSPGSRPSDRRYSDGSSVWRSASSGCTPMFARYVSLQWVLEPALAPRPGLPCCLSTAPTISNSGRAAKP